MYYKVLRFNKILTNKKIRFARIELLYLQKNQGFMQLSPRKLNLFLAFKLPAAFWCGVRAKRLTSEECIATVRYRWISQNPFKSMYFAVQAMAAELTTGALVMLHIKKSGASISMLVLNNKATYSKKAVGKITFICTQGATIDNAIQQAISTGDGQTIVLQSVGRDEQGDIVSIMDFEWTLKLKSNKS
ncbi:MAG: hypothetical protein RLZZ500_222 [Bacteroidota bacterium]